MGFLWQRWWLKERESEEKINRVMGEREREREIGLYYFIG